MKTTGIEQIRAAGFTTVAAKSGCANIVGVSVAGKSYAAAMKNQVRH